MKRIMLSLLAILIVAGTGSALLARGMWGNGGGCPGYGMGMNGGPGYHGMMYGRLNLTEDQELKIHKINKDFADRFFEARKDREAFDKVRENHRKEIEKVLTKEQLEKINEFRGPRNGKGRGMYPDKGDWKPGMMHGYLNITDEQAEKIHKLNRDFHDRMFENRKNSEEIEKLRESHRKEFEKILTREQLDKLKDFQKNHRGMGGCPGFGGMW